MAGRGRLVHLRPHNVGTTRAMLSVQTDLRGLDQIPQIRVPSWHHGRIALLGDAAWCAGPFGTGTTSALAGAYVVAGELAATPDDVPAAFTRYENVLRPLTERAQTFVPHRGHPHAERERVLLRTALSLGASPLAKALGRLSPMDPPAPPVNTIDLSRYPVRHPTAA